MATVAARGSGTPATTGTTWASVTNAVDGTAGTNPATYATMTNATASAVATIEVTGYGFSTTIGSADTLNSVTVSLRHFENNTARFTSVTFQAFDGATAIGTATTCTLATAARNDTATPAVTLAQLRSSTFKIRVTVTGAASTQSRVESIDYVDVTADYTPLPPTITQAAYRFYADGTETGAIADRYSESNRDSALALGQTSSVKGQAQSFTGNGQTLLQAGFFLRRLGSPVGNVTAVLYAHSGTFGTNGVPTGSALATSTPVNSASVSTTYGWQYFTFDGTFTLVNGTRYFIAAEAVDLGNASNCLSVGIDASSPAHAGSEAQLSYAGAWTSWSEFDLPFEIHTDGGALAAQDTGYTADTSAGDVNLQVRVRLQSTNSAAIAATDDFQLQWEKNTSGTWTNVASAGTVNGYASANLTDAAATTNRLGALGSTLLASSSVGANLSLVDSFNKTGQSFLGDGRSLTRAGFQVSSVTATSGTFWAELYAHTGTFGAVGGIATGTALATSTSIAVTSVAAGWVYLDFDGTFTLTNGTPYVIAATTNAPSGGVRILYAISGGTHPGTYQQRDFAAVWRTTEIWDTDFEVYTAPAFVAGKVSEDGLVDDLGWTANNYTELLYSVTLKQADLTPTDTLRFRVLRNGATTGLTYTQYPSVTIGTAGPTDRTGTATGTISISGSSSGQKDVTGTGAGSLTVTGAASGVITHDVVGTATGSLTVIGAGAGVTTAAPVLGTATGAVALSGVAVGTHGVTGTATGSLTVAGTASGQKTVTSTAAGTLAVTGTGAGVRGRPGVATGTLTLAGTAAGVRQMSGVAVGAITLTGTATGGKTVTATATGSLTLSGTATGLHIVAGTAAGALALTGTASGTKTVTATASSSLTVTGVGSGAKTVTGTGTGAVVFGSTALGLVEGNAVGTAGGLLTTSGVATGVRGRPGTGTGTIALTGTAVGRRGTPATATGQLTLTGTATGTKAVTATVTATITITSLATGVGSGVVTTIIGEWNDQEVTGLQWGSLSVVDWFMLVPTAVNGTGSGSLTFTGVAVGTSGKVGVATGTITVTGTATGVGETPAAGTPPVIATTNTEIGTALGTANAIPLPSGVTAGDLLVAVTSNAAAATATTFSGTWTQITNQAASSNTVRLLVLARIADATANDNLALTAAATADYCALTMRVTGHGVTTVATDIKQAVTATGTANTSPDPPNLDAGSTKAWLWLAAAAFGTSSSGQDFTATPAGYTLINTIQSANATGGTDLSVTQKASTSAQTENPAAFTISSSLAWAAATIAIPGAAP